ncbi:MAG: hypothetical protein KFB95_06345 [Simkaniaceae bacterium]|nr:MAG: hypothetical protein KFB95_06345 [Simkaniaceae bacterium]
MSSTEAIGKNAVQAVGFEPVEREEEKVKGLALDAATQTHFNSVKDALMEVAKADAQKSHGASAPKAKNSMITTFKIMKIVMETLRESSDSSKETNKLLKKEWKAISDKQSENNQSSMDNVKGNQNWLLLGQAGGFIHYFAHAAVGIGLDKKLGDAFAAVGASQRLVGYGAETLTNIGGFLKDAAKVKEGISSLKGIAPQLASGGSSFAQNMTQAEQYNLGIKESLFSHEVQTHTSEYQNGSQQQTSDKQAVDNAADTAKQLIRVQGEILMGKAG